MFAVLLYAVLPIAAFLGWVLNILALISAPPLAYWGSLEVLRSIGIFVAPLGAVLGYV